MNVIDALQGVELFDGLTTNELQAVAALCEERRLKRGDVLIQQGQPGLELYIVTEGFVEVVRQSNGGDQHVVVQLGPGQIVGEMALVDQGPRSATVRALNTPTVVQVIPKAAFDALCERNTTIGYKVMRNMAADLSFRIRHRNLSE